MLSLSDDQMLLPVRLAPVHLLVAEPAAGPHLPHVAGVHEAAHCVLLVSALKCNLENTWKY